MVERTSTPVGRIGYSAATGIVMLVLTFFGFIHGPGIGIDRSPTVAFGYLGVAAILFACHHYAESSPALPHADEAIATAAE